MPSAFKIAIVGSGPAGLSAAARAAQLGISHVLLEKTDHLSDTIYKYQKGKHVMATPSQLVLRSDLGFEAGKREKVLGNWDDQTAGHKVNVKLNAEVSAITGEKGAFRLKTRQGEEIEAETVILGIGTQGNPNLVRCAVGEGAQVQYQLDDPGEYIDEHITVIGAGDAGIENALGLAADPEQRNTVTIVNRSAEFATAKDANIQLMVAAEKEGRLTILRETTASAIEKGEITFDTRDGELKVPCDRVIARMGSAPPRAFVEGCCAIFEEVDGKKKIKAGTGVEFSSPDRVSYPKLSPTFESTVPGIYVIGALAGYPLIKHCMNQGHDAVEFINGNIELKPADEPILEAKFAGLPGRRSVEEWLGFLKRRVTIFNDMSLLQMREFMLDSDPVSYRPGDVIFTRNEPGSSLFAIADGSVVVEVDPANPNVTVPIDQGSIVGEVGLISGRKRGATVRAASGAIVVEIPRNSALKLMSTVPAAKREITRISTERQLLQMLGSDVTQEDLTEVLESAEIVSVKAGEAIIEEGESSYDIFVIRQGSMVVEKDIGGKPVFLSYLPAGSYVGEMALIDRGRRTATVRAAIKSEVIKLNGDAFRHLLEAKPELLNRFRWDMETRQELTAYIEDHKDGFGGVIDLYSNVASFLVDNGIGEATDLLLIDEKLCVGCDNCEKACADAHEGLSRLNREAGKTFAHLHVPTSCRHCEHPHCMADCPPNAIHRGPDGEVYIDDTCIGCGNCQRNCPYGVIRMDKVPPKKPSLLAWMLAGLGPGPGEPNKKWTEKRVSPETPKKAIKCDMCSGIEGGPACVRACPTGAAIRVAPEEFLTVARMEKGAERGVATRGIERTDLGDKASHESFLRHRRYYWAKVAGGFAGLAILIYLLTDPEPRPNGGSWYGYLLGTMGAGLIFWLTALGIRKRNITRKAWSLKAWTSAHVYLGLSLIVIATLHTGFQFGWNVHTLAYSLMMVVIVSGIYGVTAYAVLPKALSDNRGEMTAVQMIDAVDSLDKQIQISAQPLSDEDSAVVLASLGEDPFGGGLWRRLTGTVKRGGNIEALKAIRRRLGESEGEEAIALDQVAVLLQRKAAALSRVRRHVRIRAMLEIWLYVHIPMTFALIAALSAHIISVFFYW